MLYCGYLVTGQWQCNGVVTMVNYQQHGDWGANDFVVTVVPAVNNSDYTVTVQSPDSHSAAYWLME